MFSRNAIAILCAFLLTVSGIVCGAVPGQSLAAPDKFAGAPLGHVQAQPQEVRNIILFSWDGLDRSVIRDLLTKKKVPHLAELMEEGSFQKIEVRGHLTVTKPGHAEMLTGLSADVTGVYANVPGKYRPIPEGYTIFERLQAQFGKDQIATIFVAGKLAHLGGRGPGEQIDKEKLMIASKWSKRGKVPAGADDVFATETTGEPFFLTKKHLDVFDVGQRDAGVVGPLCIKYLKQYRAKRFFAFLHFSDPDHAGHQYGSGSSKYRQAAEDCDKWLGKIVWWLKEENLYDSTLIYVTTDHGFDRHARTHFKAPNSWLVTNDKLVKHGGIIADLPATILARFGLDLARLNPQLLGIPLL